MRRATRSGTATATGARNRYDYASVGKLARVVDPAGGETSLAYTIREYPVRIRDAGGTTTDYVYDPDDRVVEVRGDGRAPERYATTPRTTWSRVCRTTERRWRSMTSGRET
jgi:YD repeat-containing protein